MLSGLLSRLRPRKDGLVDIALTNGVNKDFSLFPFCIVTGADLEGDVTFGVRISIETLGFIWIGLDRIDLILSSLRAFIASRLPVVDLIGDEDWLRNRETVVFVFLSFSITRGR